MRLQMPPAFAGMVDMNVGLIRALVILGAVLARQAAVRKL